MLSLNVKKIIDNIFLNKKLSHCYLFNLINHTEDQEVLHYFISKIEGDDVDLKNTQNIYTIEALDKKTIKKEDILEAFKNIDSTSQFDNKKKIIIIQNVDLATLNGINSILKIIEEPIQNSLILLTTSNISRVLPTIKSRSFLINVFASSNKKDAYDLFFNLTKSKRYSLMLCETFDNQEQAKELLDDKTKELALSLIVALEKSWKNKYQLYTYLSSNLTIEKKEFSYFLLKSLAYFFRLILLSSPNPEELRLISKITKKNFEIPKNTINNLNTFIYDVNNFIINVEANTSFALQKEILLSKLMEYYG
ncbi:DNA polymerase III subunit delta [Mycoplasma crocodyli]|uniref:DNA polymerase III, delta' subunit n=1 Tax=Mycoplasma crocodyli (strain ATCC 51981 / MP145) TaxID=512564 RepID=D5E6D7_MYCCM|nr:DNA polymerase III subunit delta [Mycoplasma crocodyli]ADE19550.1 DNA polymerase III, delta' subunit [Mycoplasma crocodyli MP145]